MIEARNGIATPERLHDERSRAYGGQHIWLLCRAGSFLCALPLAQVVEIMRVLRIEAVAGAPACVRGLSIIRGTPTPIIDTALLLGGRPAPAERLVIVRTGTRMVALAVYRVLGVRSIEGIAEPLPPLLQEAACDRVSAIGLLDAELLLFLSAARLVPEEALERLGSPEALA
jgi:purine-binding chemotaxis protein CheW